MPGEARQEPVPPGDGRPHNEPPAAAEQTTARQIREEAAHHELERTGGPPAVSATKPNEHETEGTQAVGATKANEHKTDGTPAVSATKPNKHKTDATKHVSLAIAILALVISAANFWYTQLRRNHEIRGQVVRIDTGSPNGISVEALIMNSGNQTEVFAGGEIIFSKDIAAGGGSVSREKFEPGVLKPGDAILREIRTALPAAEELSLSSTPEFAVDVGVLFFVISPTGELLESTYPITRLTVQRGQVVRASPKGLKDYGLMDLIREGRTDEPRPGG